MNSVNKNKKFFGIYFKGGSSWAIIPRNWMIFPQRACYWPNRGDVEELSKLMVNPDSDWSIWNLSRISVASDDYDRATSKMINNDLADTTDVDTASPGGGAGPKRKDSSSNLAVGDHKNEQMCQVRKSPRLLVRQSPSSFTKTSCKSLFEKASSGRTCANSARTVTTISSQLLLSPSAVPKKSCKNLFGTSAAESSDEDNPPRPCSQLYDNISVAPITTFQPSCSFKKPKPSPSEKTLTTLVEKMLKLQEKLLKNVESNTHLLEEIIENSRKVTKSPDVVSMPKPASTVDELEDLAGNPVMVDILSWSSDISLSRTVSNMMRVLMTRSLAIQYSFTGLSKARQKLKLTFKSTPACALIERVLKNTNFKDVSRKDVHNAIGTALKNASDWDGHRGKRVKGSSAPTTTEQDGCQLSSATTSHTTAEQEPNVTKIGSLSYFNLQ